MADDAAFDLLIRDATIVAPHRKIPHAWVVESADVGIHDKKIAAIGSLSSAYGKAEIQARGLTLLPGAIDTQVHFRDPGFPEKEDMSSGSRAALFGGVTTFFDMPNTQPPTLTAIDVADKMSRAEKRAWVNYAFYAGASPSNINKLAELEKLPHVCGVKIFMGSSTGNLVIGSDENLEATVSKLTRPFAVHAEDDARLKERRHLVEENPGHVEMHPEWRDVETALIATKKIAALAKKYGKRVHILHISTAEEIEFFKSNCKAEAANPFGHLTFEITPQHLTLTAPECYEKLGTRAQMNPPIRDKRHQDALWTAIRDGLATTIGSDHAPHTLAEKNKTYPQSPSGMAGVQTLLPIMLNHVHLGRLSLTRLVELTSSNPARLFGLSSKGSIEIGKDADFALVDLKAKKIITNSWIQSRCGWTPFDGFTVQGWVVATIVGGQISMRDGEVIGSPKGSPALKT